MMGKKPKTIQKRRTKKELNEMIWTALERMIIKSGFNSITLVDLAREAGVEPPVIYNRFADLDDLFNQYAVSKDFWLNNSIQLAKDLNFKENCTKVYYELIDNLFDNEIMQRILLWELNDTHKITRRMAMSREFENSFLLTYLNTGVKKSKLNLNFVNAIIISGIYYLILHKNISTFSAIDFKLEDSKEQLKETVRIMVDRLFE